MLFVKRNMLERDSTMKDTTETKRMKCLVEESKEREESKLI